MVNQKQFPLPKEKLRGNQIVRLDMPLKFLWLALIAIPTTINLLDAVLHNVARKPR